MKYRKYKMKKEINTEKRFESDSEINPFELVQAQSFQQPNIGFLN